MKLTNNRYYFDYNATSPLASSVSRWLAKGDLPYGNPSSIHATGKTARRAITQVKDFLGEFFGLPHFQLFFHSGASEGIASLIYGHALHHFKSAQSIDIFMAHTDHSCVYNLQDNLRSLGHRIHLLEIDGQGDLKIEQAISRIKQCRGPTLLNFMYVNNESGVVWPLEQALTIKQKTNCVVHVDAVQAIGKIERFWELSSELDAYTFSGHKFGALKGVGFSLLHPRFLFIPYVRGGGQQGGLRSGTENVTGIESLKLALEELREKFNFSLLNEAKEEIERRLLVLLQGEKGAIKSKTHGEIIGLKAKHRNANTIYFTLLGHSSLVTLTAFDLAGIDVSSGSACSSGAIRPSRILLGMGRGNQESKEVIRLSFSPQFHPDQVDECWNVIYDILQRFVLLNIAT